jgi:hypothetical protein
VRKIPLPRISERIRGFTAPKNGVFFVFDYDEVHKVSLGDQPIVEILDDDPYVFAEKVQGGFGVSDREPIRSVGDSRLEYKFHPGAPSVTVNVELPDGKRQIEFRTFSGDWFVATFSPCGKYLVLAEPYLIELFEIA